ncbi:MAG: DMT family transporter [Clostridia bacterium]|nr:DMT family transporter [Clostridia bacterium]
MSGKNKSRYRLYLIAVLCTVLWGSAVPTIKLGYEIFSIAPSATADQLMFAGIRFFGAGLLLLIPYGIVFGKVQQKKDLWTHAGIIGLIQTAGQYFFMYIGLSYTSGVNASVLSAVGTLLYVVLAWVIFRDQKMSKIKAVGCMVGFFGILLNSLSTQKMGLLSWKGDGFVMISNICVAVGFLYSKYGVKNQNPFLLTGLQMGIGGGVLLTIALCLGGRLPTVTPAGILLLFYLMMVSSVAFSLWTALLKEYPSSLVGMFNFLTPVFGTIFSYLLSRLGVLDEASAFTIYTVIAILCSAGGILLSSMGDTTK